MATLSAFSMLTPGHVVPFVPILQELQTRGYDIVLNVCTSGDAPDEIGGVKVERLHWAEGRGPGSDEARGTRVTRARRLTDFATFGSAVAVSVERQILQQSPEVIFVDPMLWGAMVVAEASGRPWISLAHNPLFFAGTGLDVRGPGLRPPVDLVSRTLHRIYRWRKRYSYAPLLSQVNTLREQYGLARVDSIERLYAAPHLIIVTTCEPFEYPRSDWPTKLSFVGPMTWDPPTPEPDWLSTLTQKPILLIAGSSIRETGMARTWVQIAFDALAHEPFHVVATLPTDYVGHVPDNVRPVRFLSHGHVLSRAVCVICHGGPGITQKALAHGVPVVAIPFAHDRFEVARRVEVAGAGVMLPGRKLNPLRLRTAVHTAIRCAPAARKLADAFCAAGGPEKAADAIDCLLRRRGI